MSQYYAFYSADHADEVGTVIYENSTGGQVEATYVSTDPEASSYWRKDKQYAGTVTKFLRYGRPGRAPKSRKYL